MAKSKKRIEETRRAKVMKWKSKFKAKRVDKSIHENQILYDMAGTDHWEDHLQAGHTPWSKAGESVLNDNRLVDNRAKEHDRSAASMRPMLQDGAPRWSYSLTDKTGYAMYQMDNQHWIPYMEKQGWVEVTRNDKNVVETVQFNAAMYNDEIVFFEKDPDYIPPADDSPHKRSLKLAVFPDGHMEDLSDRENYEKILFTPLLTFAIESLLNDSEVRQEYLQDRGSNRAAKRKYFRVMLKYFGRNGIKLNKQRVNELCFLLGMTTGTGKTEQFINYAIWATRHFGMPNIHLIVSPWPDTLKEFQGRVNKWQDFIDESVEYIDSKKFSNKSKIEILNYDKNKIYLIGVSMQDIKMKMVDKKGGKQIVEINDVNEFVTEVFEKRFSNLADYKFGLLGIDEAHFGTRTTRWQEVQTRINYQASVFITATPHDYLADSYFPDEFRFLYSYEDIMAAKINGEKWAEVFPTRDLYMLNIASAVLMYRERGYSLPEDFNFEKLFDYDKNNVDNGHYGFKYGSVLVELFKEMFKTGDGQLTITGLNGLCDFSKNHGIMSVPTGDSDAVVRALKNLLIRDIHTIFGKNADESKRTKIFTKADNKISEIQDFTDKNAIGGTWKSLTLTCNRWLTGVDVPAWGYLVLLRSIKDIKLQEQSFGRVNRPVCEKGIIMKPNCAIFIADPEYTISLSTKAWSDSMKHGISIEAMAREMYRTYPVFYGDGNGWIKADEEYVLKLIVDSDPCGIRTLRNLHKFDLTNREIPSEEEELIKSLTLKDSQKSVFTKKKNKNGTDKAKTFVNLERFQKANKKEKDPNKMYKLLLREFIIRIPELLELTNWKVKSIGELFNLTTIEQHGIEMSMDEALDFDRMIMVRAIEHRIVDVFEYDRWIEIYIQTMKKDEFFRKLLE